MRHLAGPLAAAALVTSTLGASACGALRTSDLVPSEGEPLALMQNVLRVAMEDNSPLLADTSLGPYTRGVLVDLCEAVPVTDDVDPVRGTFDLILDYDRLGNLFGRWRDEIGSEGFAQSLSPLSPDARQPLILRLAGPPGMTAAALGPAPATEHCGEIPLASLSPDERAGLAALMRIESTAAPSDETLGAVCEALPAAGGRPAFLSALGGFARIDRAESGALDDLSSAGFVDWLQQDAEARLLRLVGTDAAVIRLVRDYRAAEPDVDDGEPEPVPTAIARDPDLPPSCVPSGDGGVLRYTSFGPEEVQSVGGMAGLADALEAFQEQRFPTRDALFDELVAQLPGGGTDCVRDRIAQLVDAGAGAAEYFSLDAEILGGLAFDAGLQEDLPLVETFLDRVSPTEEQLLDGLRAALRKAAAERISASIESAADTVAAAAEEVAPVFDTVPDDEIEYDPVEVPETIGVTDNTVSALTATVTDDEFQQALTQAEYLPAPNPEVLKGDVRRILRPIGAARVTGEVEGEIAALRPAVRSDWRLTQGMAQAILALPGVAPSGAELPGQLREIVGVSYPNVRLFETALDTLEGGLPAELRDSILIAATKTVDRPNDDRLVGPLALEDCGCVPRRRADSLVYGFYPFWLSPFAPDPDAPAIPAAGDAPAEDEATGGEGGAEIALQPRIDFGLIGRTAFYGLELAPASSLGRGRDATPSLRFRERWTEARREFVNAAHRHRAKADLAITLRDWDAWSDPQIADVVETIDELMLPFDRFESYRIAAIRDAIPTLLDPVQPDGVTLILEGYTGLPDRDAALGLDKVQTLVTSLHRVLEPRGQAVNLAFLPLIGASEETTPLFSDLFDLLVRGRDAEPTVERLLLFLERRTTDSKKRIRSRLEHGDFKGANRADLQRRIVPVVPDGGHRFVLTQSNDPDAAEDEPDQFSQFDDDVVYFRESFGGVGFWPLPVAGGPETAALAGIVASRWNLTLPRQLQAVETALVEVCDWSCPQRVYITGVALAIFVLVTALVWRSFYSGLANRIAFRMGAVWVGTFVLTILLVVLSACDPLAFWPPILLAALVLLLVALVFFNTYQRARNGPKP